MNLDFSTTKTTRKAGTKKRPRSVNMNIAMTQSTRSGTGKPATSTDLNITLPAQFRFNGKIWPKRLRCNPRKANQRRSNSVCPRGSKIGEGDVTAVGGQDGSIVEELSVTAYVTTGGDLGLWLRATAPVPISEMLVGEVSRGRKVEVAIPNNIQEPVPGVPTAITKLDFGLNKKARVNGRSRGVVESTGCKRRRWTLAFQNVYRHGSTTDTDTTPCRA